MFIKSIAFPKGHPFYNNGESIVFGDSQKDLIDFYLRTTNKIKEGEKDIGFGNNIQINCILGDNGAGKSTFLKEIYDFSVSQGMLNKQLSFTGDFSAIVEEDDVIFEFNGKEQGRTTQKITKPNLAERKISIILDDYFVGSWGFNHSINKESLQFFSNGYGGPSNIKDIYNFLKRRSTNKKIFEKFLNLPEDYIYKLVIKSKKRENYAYYWHSNSDIAYEKLKNIDTIFKGVHIFIQEYLNVNSNLFKDIPQIKIEATLMSILDLVFLYVEELRINTIQNENYYTNSKDNNFKITEGIKSFISGLEIVKIILNIILKKDYDDIYGDISAEFRNVIPHFITKLTNWINALTAYIEGDNIKANEIYGSMNIKVTKAGLYNTKEINGFLLNETGYGFVNRGLTDSKAFLVEYIFTEDIGDFNYAHIFGDIRNIYSHQIENINGNGNIILEYFGDQIEDRFFPFLYLDNYFEVDLVFVDSSNKFRKDYNALSGGEKSIITRFTNTFTEIHTNYLKGLRYFIVLIDEPDLHLHLDWQRQYIQRLIDVFSTIQYPDISLHFIIATHSPFIVSDLPGENIIRMRKDSNGIITFQNYGEGEEDKKTSFGANYIDIIQEGFFDNRLLMGSFAEDVITNLAIADKIKLSKKLLKDGYKGNKDTKGMEDYLLEGDSKIERIKQQIGDEFIKNHLLYF